jgi:coiled-coil domain-containing protein 130
VLLLVYTAQVGSYHSTKVWAFTMRHHCGCKITIQTDPKNAEYLVTDGARRKIESYDADDAQTIEIPDANERAAISSDPLASLERKTIHVSGFGWMRRQVMFALVVVVLL